MLFTSLQDIFTSYSKLDLKQKIFLSLRYITCPWDLLLLNISNNKSILDLGCGHGLFLHLIKRRFNNVDCTGLDHDPQKIEFAKACNDEIKFFTTNEINLIPKASFDYVSIIDVFYCLPLNQWDKLFSMVSEYLKPGGILLIKETVNKPTLKYYFCLIQEIFALKVLRYTKGEFPQLLPVNFYINQINENNFELVNHFSVSKLYLHPHYLFISYKK